MTPPDPSDREGALDRMHLAAIVESSGDAIVSKDLDGTVRSWNPAAERIFGYAAAEIVGGSIFRLIPPDLHEEERLMLARIRDGEPVVHYETTRLRKDGRPLTIALTVSPIRGPDGALLGVSAIKRDITAQRALEAQLRQAQKMESVGRLAGGVAHDFNNLLTVIMSGTGQLLEWLPAGGPPRATAEEIQSAAQRAATLTRQLLALSRRQVLERRVLDLNAVVAGTERLLQRLIGEDVALRTVLAPDLSPIVADAGQIEQVIMNLAVNARDAMPQGGMLSIETRNVVLDGLFAAERFALEPGPYVMLAVSDSGIGMDAVTLASVFEPFFTTKEPGRGTGLGLSTVYGIVQQTGGSIYVYSEPGNGTTFKIYFPRSAAAGAPQPGIAEPEPATAYPATVLLVEDEPVVRRSVARALLRAGFQTLVASDGQEAVAVAAGHGGPIDLILTDVVMPGMTGLDLAERIMAARPETSVLYTSGYADDHVLRTGAIGEGKAFLAKPFTSRELVARIREVIASRRR